MKLTNTPTTDSIRRLGQGVGDSIAAAEPRPAVAFSTLLVAPNLDRGAVLRSTVANAKRLLLLRTLEEFVLGHQLMRLLNHMQPEVVIVDLFEPKEALQCAAEVKAILPNVVIIGVGNSAPGDGFTATVPYPPSADDLVKVVEQSVQETRGAREKNLLAFLPAKAGCGASTIALNTAGALAALNHKVLVVDADLRSGSLAIMLNQTPDGGLQSVLQRAGELDRFVLDRAIIRVHGLDLLLPTGSSAAPLPNWEDYFRLLEFARSSYDYIVVDLPELVNPASREIVRRAETVFNVCTPEIVPLKLAERRCFELEESGVPSDRIHVLINRFSTSALKVQDVEQFLDRPVRRVFPNDYSTVRSAILGGTLVPLKSPLGAAYDDFARELTGAPPALETPGSILSNLFSFR